MEGRREDDGKVFGRSWWQQDTEKEAKREPRRRPAGFLDPKSKTNYFSS
jgi:hypothetical protein